MMTEAEEEREKLRVDSEARDIIHDVNSLTNRDELQKTRWVWEFLQNAKDTDEGLGVDITFMLENDKITISHNGAPFETKHLIAILHKKSTKSLGGDDGTTGKYGTGFVTTHILSKVLNISGIHRNTVGERKFQIAVDRTSATLEEREALIKMKRSIKTTFDEINKIGDLPPEIFDSYTHSFVYELSESGRKYAEKGLDELEKNVVFTLLVNGGDIIRKKIKSIKIIRNSTSNLYRIEPGISKVSGLKYVSSGNNDGILYSETDNLIFGIPVAETMDGYLLKSLENRAVLFREFPLIGTENFNLPVFIQHNDFRPTEPRDGVVTKRETESEKEFTPDANRICMLEFRKEYLLFLDLLVNAKVDNLYYLTLSGLPIESKNYTGEDWYLKNIQKPIRDFLTTKELVQTVSKKLIRIGESKFPLLTEASGDSFYEVLIGLLPDQIPNNKCYSFLDKVINQEIENWPENISISLEQLLSNLPTLIITENGFPYESLKIVYQYLQSINSTLGETFPIYPNEKNELKVRGEVRLYPTIDDEMKFVSHRLGRDLDLEFLNRALGIDVPGIAPFDLENFYKSLNNEVISKIPVETASVEQILAILHINTLFKTDRAHKREEWLNLIKELLPNSFGDKKYIAIDYDNYQYPAELWTAKYFCYLVQNEITMTQFAKVYFEEDLKAAYYWLNRFLNYLNSSRDDIKLFLTKYKVVPTQNTKMVIQDGQEPSKWNGVFKAYEELLYKEDNPRYFDEDLKTIVQDHCNYNPKEFLIANEIQVADFRTTDVNFITKHIDKLFEDNEISAKVAVGGKFHDVFNTVNSWFDKHSDASSYLKTFAAKRDVLYVISLGEGFSTHIKALKDSGKSIEDISKLAEINLSVEHMQRLEAVANELGPEALISKAQEMIVIRNQRIRWQKIGRTAEDAFKKVFQNIDMEMELFNPDLGKDFEIILKTKGYSIEIKNVIRGKENVRMSILQGRTAVLEKEHYALCVLTRPDDETNIDEEYFTSNSNFVTDIGYQIGDKIKNWDSGLTSLTLSEDIKVNLDNKTESVYVNRPIWRDGKPFSEFVNALKTYFANDEIL
ncbi:sacsin N-terminal ATP-binding-like domain-containing protein [Pedobacter sp. MR2016-24]|uniref:sacsin N-terminal ATP-binding-like domain-containing protein n=1 Tax=Pedobacter sp. MR2016-24 TaxID=2994466 RepID=UPI0022475C17|nr:hypothetical protein [Pedobacter sp. MR2016-24]MCX2483761.1 hypothetical protein [Pedobacter sp. MR2016-24]